MEHDDDLLKLEKQGLPALPPAVRTEYVDATGKTSHIWFSVFGSGPPVVLLHGGMGNSGNWAHLVPELIKGGYSIIAIDSRGHGRSSWNGHPFHYTLMASDVRRVLDHLKIPKAVFVGWSDGADIGVILADESPERVRGLFFFACNVDSSGTKPFEMTARVERVLAYHRQQYAELSPAPADFDKIFQAVQAMQSNEPNYTPEQLARIDVPVTVCVGEHEEFIAREHLEYLSNALPDATFELLPDVGHFAPWQRPEAFNDAVIAFLGRLEKRCG
ncbi:alpha/beta fold hydrolase [Diaphorobacter aerolatus]|uniref:Alpha/beta hydrolase n=1 Tax=Diaphorobacter aerolatus TaxID=1288495 RepID=A0A7H0GK58_9BURK|nr:alpha/beta hydrolase [Diaphorobacter aerolatus]QNP48674.1 alpha/beta hydrolase [Diaphorobacter aerolatus]